MNFKQFYKKEFEPLILCAAGALAIFFVSRIRKNESLVKHDDDSKVDELIKTQEELEEKIKRFEYVKYSQLRQYETLIKNIEA